MSEAGAEPSHYESIKYCTELPSGTYRAMTTCVDAESWNTIGLAFLYRPNVEGSDPGGAEERWAAVLKSSLRKGDWSVCLDIGADLVQGHLQLQTPIVFAPERFVRFATEIGDKNEQRDRLKAMMLKKGANKLHPESNKILETDSQRRLTRECQQETVLSLQKQRNGSQAAKETIAFLCKERDDSNALAIYFTISQNDPCSVGLIHESAQVDELDFDDAERRKPCLNFSLVVHDCDMIGDNEKRALIRCFQPLQPLLGAQCTETRVSVQSSDLCWFYEAVILDGGYCTMGGVDWIAFLRSLSAHLKGAKDLCNLVSIDQWITVAEINCHRSELDADKAMDYITTNIKSVQCSDIELLLKLLDDWIAPQLERAVVIVEKNRRRQISFETKEEVEHSDSLSSLSSECEYEYEDDDDNDDDAKKGPQQRSGCTLQ